MTMTATAEKAMMEVRDEEWVSVELRRAVTMGVTIWERKANVRNAFGRSLLIVRNLIEMEWERLSGQLRPQPCFFFFFTCGRKKRGGEGMNEAENLPW